MKIFFRKLNILNQTSKTAILAVALSFIILLLGAGLKVRAIVWEEPSAEAPEGNMYVPLNVGPDNQAKKGSLILNPLYNPSSGSPSFNYPFAVEGPEDAFVSLTEVPNGGDLTVDMDSLYVDGSSGLVGLGTSVPASLVDVEGGGILVNTSSGYAIASSTTGNAVCSGNSESCNSGIYAVSLADNSISIYGQATDVNGVGIYGLNTGGGFGIYASSEESSAVVGTTNAPLSYSGSIVSAIYARARGLGAWAGYFAQNVNVSAEAVGRKFIPNKLEDSLIAYTIGWKSAGITESKTWHPYNLIFDGESIWFTAGSWSTYDQERVVEVDPDNMQVKKEIILGSAGNHNLARLLSAGGYIWVAHNYCDSGGCEQKAAITRIDPSDYSYNTYVIGPTYGSPDYYSSTVDMLYDDFSGSEPYIWALVRVKRTEIGHLIVQMKIDGTIIKSFSISPLANGGNKCLTYAAGGDVDQCSDSLDNDQDGLFDNGLCVVEPTPSDQTSCEAAGWTWTSGVCSDKTYTNETDCVNNCGAGCWAAPSCGKAACDTQAVCSGASQCLGGVWDSNSNSCSDPNCPTQSTCEGGCPGTWKLADTECASGGPLGVCSNAAYNTWGECISNGDSWAWNNTSNDERLALGYLGAPYRMSYDGEYIWLDFYGAPSWSNSDYFAGEGLARFKPDDPDNPSKQYVYCSGPDTRPSDIAYDSGNNIIWATLAPEASNDNRGLLKVYAKDGGGHAAGDIYQMLWHIFGTSGDAEFNLKYYPDTPGGPSMWVRNFSYLHKLNPDDNSVLHSYYRLSSDMDMLSFDFDFRNSSNPVVWQGVYNGQILQHTMDNPPGYSTTAYILNGDRVDSLLFDGSYVWVANHGSSMVSQYRPSDGRRLADYDVGTDSPVMVYDGKYIWFFADDLTSPYHRLDPRSGEVTLFSNSSGINIAGTHDAVYDGRYMWQAVQNSDGDYIAKVDMWHCGELTHDCSSAANISIPVGLKPERLKYDGQSVWVSYSGSSIISKISGNSVVSNLTIAELPVSRSLPSDSDYIQAWEYDGTYLWLGGVFPDNDGNGIFKIDLEPDTGGAGVCSQNNSQGCNFDSDCGAGNSCLALVVGKYPIYYNTVDNQTDVSSITFDSRYIWVAAKGYNGSATTGVGVCNDGLDNDGDGMCDYDGSLGSPGCSGRPDPDCSDANDTDEQYNYGGSSYDIQVQLSRLEAATGRMVESLPVRSGSGLSNSPVYDAVFDGSYIWIGSEDFEGASLERFYTGQSYNYTDLSNLAYLFSKLPLERQSGNAKLAGEADFGADFIVGGDLIVENNSWGGSQDNLVNFGDSCPDGEFAKGLQIGQASSFGTAGDLSAWDSSHSLEDLAIWGEKLFVSGFAYSTSDYLKLEKRESVDGSYDTAFGSGLGYIDGSNFWNRSYAMDVDSTGIYVGGSDISGKWRLEKRDQSDGSLAYSQVSSSSNSWIWDLAVDDSYIYAVGDGDGTNAHIEKRNKQTGNLCTAAECGIEFGNNGVVSVADSYRLRHITVAGNYMYVSGKVSSVSNDYVIMKFTLSQGLLCNSANAAVCGGQAFGDGDGTDGDGKIVSSSYSFGAIGINSANDYMYVAGGNGADAVVQKRRLTDGTLCSAANPCGGDEFGSDGTVVADSDSWDSFLISVDDNYLYFVSPGDSSYWHIEKRRLTDGTLCSAANPCGGDEFGSGGIVISSVGVTPRAVVSDNLYLYIGGGNSSTGWVIEKRKLSDGSLDNYKQGKLHCRSL